MQRVRMSLPYFRDFGWQPYVLAVAPTGDQPLDPLLAQTVPSAIAVKRVRALPAMISKGFGIGNLALRALPSLYTAGSRLIAKHDIDLVYFSTTMCFAMPLGRLWRRRFGVPYVLDMQDPWLSDYYEEHPESHRPSNYPIARRLHAKLEPWTMKRVSALIAVTETYLTTLRERYPWLTEGMCTVLPFGASSRDFELLEAYPQPNRSFDKQDGSVHGVYVGRGGDDMRPALRILFGLLRRRTHSSQVASRSIKLHFVGTDYATDARARKTIEPVARDADVGALVDEHTGRVPYFEALQLMRDADFLILIGSDDPGYTASKVYPYLMAGKTIVAVVHERSGLVPVLREAGVDAVITFSDAGESVPFEAQLALWDKAMAQINCPPNFNDSVIARHSAREMTRSQCLVFDRVMQAQRRG
jgi:hypothetical protein